MAKGIKRLYIGVDPATHCCVTKPYASKGELIADNHPCLLDIIVVDHREPYFKEILKHIEGEGA